MIKAVDRTRMEANASAPDTKEDKEHDPTKPVMPEGLTQKEAEDWAEQHLSFDTEPMQDDQSAEDITDAVLNEINQQQRSGYSAPLNGTSNQPIANDPEIDVSETTTEILNEMAKRQRTQY